MTEFRRQVDEVDAIGQELKTFVGGSDSCPLSPRSKLRRVEEIREHMGQV
jgi:hypothetical protein